MLMKYPIGIQSFEQIITDGYAYVDKTALIYRLTHEGKVYFLSRPRRFGKSLLVSTLKNYYLGRKELFKGLAMEQLETEWKQYAVFHLSFGGQNYVEPYTLDKVLEEFVASGERTYGKEKLALTLGSRFKAVLKKAHEQTGLRCVVLVDEYDKPLLDVMGKPDTMCVNNVDITFEEHNRNLLKGFYSVFKEADDDLQFVLLTGVTKFSQVSVFSGFNQPNDISMNVGYDTICGISEEELETYFHASIEEMAEVNGCSYDEMKDVLRRHYDGYHFSGRMKGVYNPFSLLNAFFNSDIRDYWFATGTPTYLIRLLNNYHEYLNELTGRYYEMKDFVDYRADREMPLPMIYQSGYLTIKDYKPRRGTFLLDFPNDEVKNGFVTMVAASYLQTRELPSSWVQTVLDALEDGDTEKIHVLLTSFLASIPYTVRRHENEREQERYFTYTLYLIFRIISCYATYVEKEQSYGRLDCCVETPEHVYIFEFKLDGDAKAALEQINARGYDREYLASGKTIHKIGVSISSETGTVNDWVATDHGGHFSAK